MDATLTHRQMCALYLAVERGKWIDRAHAYKAAGWKIDPHKPPKLKLKSESTPDLDANDMPDLIPWMRQAVNGGGAGGSSVQQF